MCRLSTELRWSTRKTENADSPNREARVDTGKDADQTSIRRDSRGRSWTLRRIGAAHVDRRLRLRAFFRYFNAELARNVDGDVDRSVGVLSHVEKRLRSNDEVDILL